MGGRSDHKTGGIVHLNNLTELSKKLGTLHREVWQYHDLEAFDQLATSAQTLLVKLGFDPLIAKEAADHIKHAFICADKAVEAMKADNTSLEQHMYEEAANHLNRARTLLQLKPAGGEFEVNWWYAFRHQNGFEVGRILFEELCFYSNDPEFALLGAYYLFAAARYHSERNWEQVEDLLQKYWKILLEKEYRFLAGGL